MPSTFYFDAFNTNASGPSSIQSVEMPTGTTNTNRTSDIAGTGPYNLTLSYGVAPNNDDIRFATLAQTTLQSGLFGSFSTIPLGAQSIAAGTWSFSLGAYETANQANAFFVVIIYIWRPSTSTKVSTIYDNSAALGTEFVGGGMVNFSVSGSSATVEEGDLLVIEVWYRAIQSKAATYNIWFDTTFYGTSYVNPPQNIVFIQRRRAAILS